jgi:enoyl-CoA hydratase/carnithine racemase
VDNSDLVQVEVKDGVAVLTLDQPSRLNALSQPMVAAIERGLDRADALDVRVLLLLGAGRAFSAGGDMAEMAVPDDDHAQAYIGSITRLLARLRSFDRPIVAGVQGFAVGAGAEIALEADILLVAEDATLRQPDVSIGSTPATAFRLVRVVGPMAAARCVLAGADIKAEELLRWGAVDRIHPSAELAGAARTLATAMAQNNRKSLVLAKQALQLWHTPDGLLDLRINLASEIACYWNPEQRDSVAAFNARSGTDH